ncbi:MAG: phytanoyl-CoA dioxygenase family protein, partial [Rhizobiaceae bacterium]|nr:phytanoyl-CoA dioxygenase family protein [Rhizobiaceae bacterium]
VEKLIPDDLLKELRSFTTHCVSEVAAGRLHGELLDSFENAAGVPQLRRIVSPEAFADVYDRAMRYEPLVDLVKELLGGSVRFDHGKLNFKPPSGGAAVEWHQDWAFYPQTNDDMLAVGIMLEDCTIENGPLMVVPGSHKGKIYDHHQNGTFVGGINSSNLDHGVDSAVPLTAPAGSISIHHVRTLHGSTTNRSQTNRPLLLFNYVAVDAFPIFHSYEWEKFNARILRGEPTLEPRLSSVPVRIHAPTPKTADGFSTGSLFDLQQEMEETLYREEKKAST